MNVVVAQCQGKGSQGLGASGRKELQGLASCGSEKSQGLISYGRGGLQCLASRGGPTFLGLAFHGAVDWLARIGETRRSRDEVGGDRLRIGRRSRIGVEERLKEIGCGKVRFVKGIAVIQHPASQQSFGRFLNPLIDQCRDFAAEIRGMVQAGQLETLQGCGGCLSQIFKRRNDSG